MQITVLKETEPGESRVALVPESVKKLAALQVKVVVESSAGLEAGSSDADYEAAGATISNDRAALLHSTDVLVAINRPQTSDLAQMKAGAVIVGFLRPLDEPQALQPIIQHGLSAFAMELIPRTTRAQSMDALSSMATVVGYKAVLLAAAHVPRMFPMLTTAAGTVPPAKVLVIGAGVAGLQAIATSRRLGAVTSAYDVRPAAREQVLSLGARFVELPL